MPKFIPFRIPQSSGRYLFSFRRYSDFLGIIQFTRWKRVHWQLYILPLFTPTLISLTEIVTENLMPSKANTWNKINYEFQTKKLAYTFLKARGKRKSFVLSADIFVISPFIFILTILFYRLWPLTFGLNYFKTIDFCSNWYFINTMFPLWCVDQNNNYTHK